MHERTALNSGLANEAIVVITQVLMKVGGTHRGGKALFCFGRCNHNIFFENQPRSSNKKLC
ncbi:hypothetical protein D918_08750 [Trichuris suis]|nr:hypothetical protein D918_08750 [Trichuris suis]